MAKRVKKEKIEKPDPHICPADKNAAILWARHVVERKQNYVLLDTETTGLTENAVVISISIIGADGEILLNTHVKPSQRTRISAEAFSKHGIANEDLKDKPTFAELLPTIERAAMGKRVLIYNAKYDNRLLQQTASKSNVPDPDLITECVMIQYSKFVGVWNDYFGDYAFQRLPESLHTALEDCRATWRVIEKMAESKLLPIPEPMPPVAIETSIKDPLPIPEQPVTKSETPATTLPGTIIPADIGKPKKKWMESFLNYIRDSVMEYISPR
jgi:DNA polymerase III subunit epsilon